MENNDLGSDWYDSKIVMFITERNHIVYFPDFIPDKLL